VGTGGGGSQANPMTALGQGGGPIGVGQGWDFEFPQGGTRRVTGDEEDRDGVPGMVGAGEQESGLGANWVGGPGDHDPDPWDHDPDPWDHDPDPWDHEVTEWREGVNFPNITLRRQFHSGPPTMRRTR
jgi:hypothetical protein